MSDMKFYEDKLGKLTYEGYLSRVNGGYRDYLIYSNKIFNGEGYFTKIIDLEYEINRDIDRLIDLKKAARVSINAMANPDERLILELRYLCYKTWPEIAEAISLSESHIHRLHGFALLHFAVPEDPTDNNWGIMYP